MEKAGFLHENSVEMTVHFLDAIIDTCLIFVGINLRKGKV
jgi:hypothetical protein